MFDELIHQFIIFGDELRFISILGIFKFGASCCIATLSCGDVKPANAASSIQLGFMSAATALSVYLASGLKERRKLIT